MDIGMGIHGEAGLVRRELASADEVADLLLELVLGDLPLADPPAVWVIVNTLGATPLMEGYIVLRRIGERLGGLGIELSRALVGEYVTSLEMSGLSLTLASSTTGSPRCSTRRRGRSRCPLFGFLGESCRHPGGRSGARSHPSCDRSEPARARSARRDRRRR